MKTNVMTVLQKYMNKLNERDNYTDTLTLVKKILINYSPNVAIITKENMKENINKIIEEMYK